MSYVVGMDLGGTNLRAAVVDESGRILSRARVATGAADGPDAVIARMAECAKAAWEDASLAPSDILAIGVGAPGPLNTRTGTVIEAPNLPGWKNIPLGARLEEAAGVTVFVENDANAAAWGEKWAGAGRDVQSLIMLTLGTGVGGGIVIDGKLLHGIDDTAAEIGHITIRPDGPVCGCGNHGCLEALASATALARRARELVASGGGKIIAELAGGDASRIEARTVHEAILRGDEDARELMAAVGADLGIAIAGLVNVLNPEMVILGGGMIGAGEYLFEPVRAEVRKRAFPVPAERARIVPAELGDDAGIIGAAGVALERARSGR